MIEYQPLESEKYLAIGQSASQSTRSQSTSPWSAIRLLSMGLCTVGIGLGYLAGTRLLDNVDVVDFLRKTASQLPFIGN